MKKIELLAPVGSYEAFLSAINNGANAVYLAGSHFGAREKATFTNEEIKQMIRYAHIRQVRVHVTVNTLIYDDEIDQVLEFIDFLYNNDVDAVIVQDLGIITLIHKLYPDLEIHASTQLNTLNYKQAQVLKSLGVSRVILAREASLQVAKEIKEKVGIEVEVFAHGALCMGYSGQCLLSSFTMKKSGNRGECLQLCRLPYDFAMDNNKFNLKEKYLLSCKDLFTLDKVGEIVEAGVSSIKIEGRVKSASYVGKVVGLYRKYLDNYYLNNNIDVEDKDLLELKKVFNREFTKGYLFNEQPRNIVNAYRPNNIGVKIGKVIDCSKGRVSIKLTSDLHQGDGIRIVNAHKDMGLFVNKLYHKGLLVNGGKAGDIVSVDFRDLVSINDEVYKTSDYLLNKEIDDNNRIVRNRFGLDIKVRAYIGKALVIEAKDNLENVVSVESEFIIDRAINSPTSKERIKEQIAKLNDSVYYLRSFEIEADEMIIIPISIINKLRNELIGKMDDKRSVNHNRIGKQKLLFDDVVVNSDDFSYVYRVSNEEQYGALKGINKENIYYNKDSDCIYAYPRINNGLIKCKNQRVLINELSDIDSNKDMIANAYLNTTNIYALYTLFSLGFKRVTLSLELGLERVANMINGYRKQFGYMPNVEVIVYGKIDLMITKYCPINEILTNKDINCGECNGNRFYLIDRKGYKLELVRDGVCNIRIINPKALHLIEFVNKLKDIGVSKLRLEFTNESDNEVKTIVNGYNNGSLSLTGVTRGYFSKEEEE